MRLDVPPGVAIEGHEGAYYLARMPDGPIIVLDGVAALIFNEATTGEREHLVDRVVDQVDGTREQVDEHVRAIVGRLIADGLLIERSTVRAAE